MNERLKQLMIQCEKKYCQDHDDYFYDMEKFAELIVRECADVLKKDMELAHIQLIPLDFNMYANGRLQRTIKQHFGVEE